MYRSLLPVLLTLTAATAAPQDGGNSDITYVKIQPVIDSDETPPAPAPAATRESRIENLPLTIPGSAEFSRNHSQASDSDSQASAVKSESKTSAVKFEGKTSNVKSEEKTSINKTNDGDNNADDEQEPIPADTNQFDSHAKSDVDYTTSSYESIDTDFSEDITETYGEVSESTEAEEKLTKAPLKFSPKSSYFSKFGGPSSTNLIETSGKRRFRSRCRCERIWNCPKLQITVPRCPEEYFLCCF